ncbi:MAG: hypothetical protein F4235_01570 [Candidatus Dadabacteria bacterium]|nr:hypothetical protein [Candidatus Dadabacteria bacterium]MYE60767.1 hypothetical protein [Candidatus Dadabacteria bacterium]MYI72705.1 hypothetical protein [Candidatus Dadabacteria bacterium]
MIQARWLIIFFAVLGMSVPSFAIDWSLGGFPSYMRTRVRVIDNATLLNNETISVVDTTLRVTPQLGLSDAVTVRAQVDVASNMIWGGATSHFFGGTLGEDDSVVLSDLRPSDRFNGAILTGPKAIDDDYGFFTVRMLHADIVLPNNLGFVRIGRQPFDWGLGILANGGHDPHSDLGFVVDRALWLKSFPAGAGTFTLVLVSDVFNNGNTLFGGDNGSGSGYDILAAAGIYNQQMGDVNVTVGAYGFPYLHQKNIFSDEGLGNNWDVDRTSLYSGLLVLKAANWSFTYEVQMFGGGELDTPLGAEGANLPLEFDYAFDMAGRLEFMPSMMAQVSTIGLEAGWAQGDDGSTGTTIEGNALPFSPAYNVDNLLFKHVIPTIYNIEGSVINAIYAKLYANMQLSDNLGFTPQVLIAWNDETDAVSAFDSGAFGSGLPATEVDEYLGTEIEGTLSWTLHPGVNLDFIGSLVLAGDGLKELQEAHAAANEVTATAEDTIWAFQTRLMVYIDQFAK